MQQIYKLVDFSVEFTQSCFLIAFTLFLYIVGKYLHLMLLLINDLKQSPSTAKTTIKKHQRQQQQSCNMRHITLSTSWSLN